MNLVSNAAPKDDQSASDVPSSTTSTATTTSCQPSSLPGQSPLERVPLEIRERICQFVGLKDARSEPPWMRYVKWEDRHQPCKRRRCCRISLCALSLVSRSMVAPAQRALFENINLNRPRTLVGLCRSLLLYPKNRGYIRTIVVSHRKYLGQRYPHDSPGERHSHPCDKPDATAFLNLLGPVISEQQPGTDEFWALESLCDLYHTYRENVEQTLLRFRPDVFIEITDTILALLLHFSPSLHSLSIGGSSWKRWGQVFQYGRAVFRECSASTPITKLVLDASFLEILSNTEFSDNHWYSCLSTVQDLTLNYYHHHNIRGAGEGRFRTTNLGIKMDRLFEWFRAGKPRLRNLQINGFDDCVLLLPFDNHHYHHDHHGGHNWNTILPLFKDSLARLEMSGYREPIDQEENQLISRFGSSSRMLTCLAGLINLVYLKVPLHYVSLHRPRTPVQREMTADSDDDGQGSSGLIWDDPDPSEEEEDNSSVGDSDVVNANGNHGNQQARKPIITADNIHQHIISEFPSSLKIADVIEYENHYVVYPIQYDGVYEEREEKIIRERGVYHIVL
ncbi:hypothetical protein B0T20DRAFT_411072 [Sordaria brevicollis]|uniref:Uncharacterized protein n=1 Tax=Sordaria brevicollis TaxID=83679 RepID=A0AAE0UBW1_SORBR|nr:hypothetical protein B0T20DRAFT_411072 [Sordaria brevicollis]